MIDSSWFVRTGSRQAQLHLSLSLLLVMSAAGCSRNDMPAPTAPEFAVVKAPKAIVTSLLDDGDGTCTAAKCTLRDAINTAVPGTDVTFADNLCARQATPATGCRITLASTQLSLDQRLQILGPTRYSLAVDGGGNPLLSAVLAVAPGVVVTVSGLTISGSPLSGIVNAGSLTLKNVVLSGNGTAGGSGGGIFNGNGGAVIMSGSTVSGNGSASGGGIFNLGGTFTLTNSTVGRNTAAGSGGGIFNWSGGVVTVTNSLVSENTAAADGGGIWTEGGAVTLAGTTVSGNRSGSRGGGLFANGPVTLQKKACVNDNVQTNGSSADPWSPVNVFVFTLGSVSGLNCGVAQP